MTKPGALPDLDAFVAKATALCRPAAVHWCDGSPAEYERLCALLVRNGTFTALDPVARPRSFLARSHPSDVARVEDRTFICSRDPGDAGPTNRWADPAAMHAELEGRFAGCMAGRTMYVLPFAMGPVGSPFALYGVQITDSAYVCVNARLMSRIGAEVTAAIRAGAPFVPCWHSVGAPLAPGQADVPWPCVPEVSGKYICHFPEEPAVWSFGSGYGGNALLGKKCIALRIASALGRKQGWMAEHMLLMALTSPQGRRYHIAAAFPSACGKTNLAMLTPTLPGWKATCLGDDITWLRPGPDGRLWGLNPEAGFFGVAPGTNATSNHAALMSVRSDAIFTNVALTPGGDVWWEGLSPAPPALTDWQGRPWTPGCGRPAAHANSRFTAAAANCPVIDPHWQDPQGVPVDAILFGGRRPRFVPLALEARSWAHGVFLGATCASETTAASLNADGTVPPPTIRRDPFAMLPFCGYHLGDYIGHWLAMGARLGAKAPPVFSVNWFRKDAQGRFLWPGYGDNARVLAWICERLEGQGAAQETAIGRLPAPGAIPVDGLQLAPNAMAELTAVDAPAWREECDRIDTWFAKIGDRLPQAMRDELAGLRARL